MKTNVCAISVCLLAYLGGGCATEDSSDSNEDGAGEDSADDDTDDGAPNATDDDATDDDATDDDATDDGAPSDDDDTATDEESAGNDDDESTDDVEADDDATDDDATDPAPDTETTDSVTPWVKDAIAICAWRTSCMGSESSIVGTLPDTTLEACVASLTAQYPSGGGSTLFYPAKEAGDCVDQMPTSCSEFRACMVDKQAICPTIDPKAWALGSICEAGTRSCSSCQQACAEESQTCSADGTHIETCEGGIFHSYPCSAFAEGQCLSIATSGSDWCIAGEVGSCDGGNSHECAGSTAVACDSGVSLSIDCSELGQVCKDGACTNDTECGSDNEDECDGDVLVANCLNGRVVDVDCGAFGATCGALSSGWNGCVFPEIDETAGDPEPDEMEPEPEPESPADTNCAETAAQNLALATELGCNQDPDLEANCEGLYADGSCVSQWETLISCFGTFSADDFQCNEENELKPKPTSCQPEREAFDACIQ